MEGQEKIPKLTKEELARDPREAFRNLDAHEISLDLSRLTLIDKGVEEIHRWYTAELVEQKLEDPEGWFRSPKHFGLYHELVERLVRDTKILQNATGRAVLEEMVDKIQKHVGAYIDPVSAVNFRIFFKEAIEFLGHK
ncbi:MAG: hypothetical protein HYW89_03375 [Candidatus Sungiibacteriota bacterium]|uniref:Uncharacterized protein n=1 Tax=Candidatus Sungiibacteriota bacterium TaxID=2750080 RepID=A0A7T5URW0_9BACT|nr:MAG: hypothetical protein HYW89_03375 [Candidatus Sungbacteria bacterium]